MIAVRKRRETRVGGVSLAKSQLFRARLDNRRGGSNRDEVNLPANSCWPGVKICGL